MDFFLLPNILIKNSNIYSKLNEVNKMKRLID